ncbi:uncharacterized protein LOC128266989 [Anopheles cruzii]|uniref:uncharacterized protein LOC128266989 n=1 Tax=Anopheles cruzii TaxID=68878 RepID=UPI0022EC4BA8|nr:uncharacterized protein LOC128266989 [Anopheles cruzii]
MARIGHLIPAVRDVAMRATVIVLILFAAACRSIEPFKGTRTYNLETDEDRYGRYERVLVGLKSSEGLNQLDPGLLQRVREVLLDEENHTGPEMVGNGHTVAIHLGQPRQSQHVAELLYRERLHGPQQ